MLKTCSLMFAKRRKSLLLKSMKPAFETVGPASATRSLSFNLELVGRTTPISTPKVVEEVPTAYSTIPADPTNEFWPENNKQRRFRLPIKLPKFKFPFFNKKGVEESYRSCEASGSQSAMGSRSVTPQTPINHDLHDSYSSVHAFASESYSVTEIALIDMARPCNEGSAQSCTPRAFQSGSSWDPHVLLPSAAEDMEPGQRCPAEEFFADTPKHPGQREWRSSPEQELENEWEVLCANRVTRRRPSSAYGYTGSTNGSMDQDRRDSASMCGPTPPPRRKGLDCGSRATDLSIDVDIDLPVSFTPPQRSPDSQPGEQSQITIPPLSLSHEAEVEASSPRIQDIRRPIQRGFGSEIPVLDEFGALGSQGGSFKSRSPSLGPVDVDQPETWRTTRASGIDSLSMDDDDDDYESDADVEVEVEEKRWDQFHHPTRFCGIEETSSGSWHTEELSPGGSTHSSLQVEHPSLEDLGVLDYSEEETDSTGLPCMSIHPDEPDFENRYPTTMVSDDDASSTRSRDERLLASYNVTLDHKPVATVLDVLEERAYLKRKECSYRVACQRSFIRQMKTQVHKSAKAFARLKQGLGPQLTDKVVQLREKFGGGLRVKRQEKLAKMRQFQEEELWDLHFNEDSIQFESDDGWVTDDDQCLEA